MDADLANLTERWFCSKSDGLYNDYATVAYKPQEESIKMLFHHFNFNKSGAISIISHKCRLKKLGNFLI